MSDISVLRAQLFATLAALQDKENPMDIDRAKAINETAQVIINSAKAECDFLKVTGGKGTGFISSERDSGITATATGIKTVSQQNGSNVTVHKIRG